MRLCNEHWAALRTAIDTRGLSAFVAKDGEEATRRLFAESKQGSARSNFDPLMASHNAILSNALNVAGLILMSNNDDGTVRCPLCFLIASCKCGAPSCPYTTWIDRAADDSLAAAKELGLVGVS